ncbi:hypothetical protein ABVK25_006956 [Lepraria finkii]|uniref:Uncharacterized protein n=1 Tax=Lepraria finkii TaxID=1340010 RepID=A0ABR4B6Q9_9LECA
MTQQILVNVYSHFVTTYDQASLYPPATRSSLMANQIAALNSAYKPASIAFTLMSTSYTVRDDWATDANSTNMKNSLRQSKYADLNIYFQSNLSSAPYKYSGSLRPTGLLHPPHKHDLPERAWWPDRVPFIRLRD